MAVIFLFIDGVGLGKEDRYNPFFDSEYPGFSAMAGGQPFSKNAGKITGKDHLFKPVDATLGVEGLPQSGTGQVTLFSGKNAAKEIGKHFGPFPHSGTMHLLDEQSLFLKAKRMGKSCRFMNAYPDIFFEGNNRLTATTEMTKKAGIDLNRIEDIKNGTALTAEITQQTWRNQLEIDVPNISPEAGADRLLEQSQNDELLLHEYYLTDKAGHSQEMEKAETALKTYDRFLLQLIQEKPEKLTIVLSSDHGNVEDLSKKTHTLNKVPLFAYGTGADQFKSAKSIADVTPGILQVLKNKSQH